MLSGRCGLEGGKSKDCDYRSLECEVMAVRLSGINFARDAGVTGCEGVVCAWRSCCPRGFSGLGLDIGGYEYQSTSLYVGEARWQRRPYSSMLISYHFFIYLFVSKHPHITFSLSSP
jgi:hypothetical protein